ncbi:response regulator [Oceanospirillum sp.]|uniref:response regulator n=1 Tax=Oceanospirillum sp. TaxID=2021254 RepID=UPI003A90445E
MIPWKILIVDDEEGIHGITRMIFRDYEFEQRPIELISAMSSIEAKAQLAQHPDIALILLDVVMETESAGLQLVKHIRETLNKPDVRIILRTGHPGYAPEAQVIIDYDINDYLSKAELSASRLLTSVIVALRSYRDIKLAREQIKPINGGIAMHGEASPQPEANAFSEVLPEIAGTLLQHVAPALKQSKRLSKLELNPVANELARDLYAHQQRLHYALSLCLNDKLPATELQAASIAETINATLLNYLPQSRQDGWVLDYHLAAELPEVVTWDTARFQLMLTAAIELALLQAQGHDLKIRIQKGEKAQELLLKVEQSEGQPLFNHSHWAEQLRQSLQQICQQLQGRFTEIDEDGQLCCRIPVQGL